VVPSLQSTRRSDDSNSGLPVSTAADDGCAGRGQLEPLPSGVIGQGDQFGEFLTDASTVRTRARAPTVTPLTTPINIG